MTRIIYTDTSGQLCVVHPGTGVSLDLILAKDIPAGATNVQIVDSSVIPSDRTFRNAWKAQGAKVEVDMVKAREIKRDSLRILRAPLLAALDIEYQRADEEGNVAAKAEIAAKKQALRDVTEDPALEAAQTPEELKTVLPDVLK